MRAEPMINVRDVEASSRWYQRLLGVRSGHGGPDFEMLMHGDELVLMLHAASSPEHHPHHDAAGVMGKGLILYLRVGDDLPAAFERARAMGADIVKGPASNELSHQEELWVRDPDGYMLVLCRPAQQA